jgi:Uma2 family endonuclease
MATATIRDEPDTLADLIRELGDIPLDRIRLKPAPGRATERDLIAALEAPRKRICELVDGVLVEKPVGTKEALLAILLGRYLWNFVDPRDLGLVVGPDGPLRLWIGLVRIPDVSFISWERLPRGELPDEAIAGVVPDLAVEVLSRGNTPKEMRRKLQEYFEAGVRLVWFIYPKTQTAEVFTSPTDPRRIGKSQSLDGDDVLPGFKLPLAKLFSRTRRRRGK